MVKNGLFPFFPLQATMQPVRLDWASFRPIPGAAERGLKGQAQLFGMHLVRSFAFRPFLTQYSLTDRDLQFVHLQNFTEL